MSQPSDAPLKKESGAATEAFTPPKRACSALKPAPTPRPMNTLLADVPPFSPACRISAEGPRTTLRLVP